MIVLPLCAQHRTLIIIYFFSQNYIFVLNPNPGMPKATTAHTGLYVYLNGFVKA